MSDLFRKEAIKANNQRLYGNIVVGTPSIFTITVIFLVKILVIAICYLSIGSYSKRETVVGYLNPSLGNIKVYAPYLGAIEEKLVFDGELVEKGDELLRVSTGKFYGGDSSVNEQMIAEIETRIDNLLNRALNEEELYVTEAEQLKQQRANLYDELMKISEQIKTQKELVDVNKQEWEKYIQFRKRGLVREADVSSRHSAYLTNKANLESIKRARLNKEMELSQVKAQLEKLPINAQKWKDELENTLAQLKERKIELEGASAYTVKAPVSGRVTAMQVNTGQTVSANKPLLTIIPKDTVLYAELYLPSRAIGFVNEGQKVLLRYDAFPYQRYGLYEGTVSNIASAVINPNEVSSPIASQEPVYKVNVELKEQFVTAYNKKMPLQSGMSVNADIILDERSLAEWLLEPIYSLRGKI